MNDEYKEVFEKACKRLFDEFKKEANDDEDSMRILLAYPNEKGSEKALVEVVTLSPAPPPSRWIEVFTRLADEIPRLPKFIVVVNQIHYAKVDPMEVLDDEDIIRHSTEGYLVMNISVDDGEVESQLYNSDFEKEKRASKNFSLFNLEQIRTFPPALAVLSLIVRLLMKDTLQDNEEDEPEIGVERHISFEMKDDIKDGVEGIDYSADSDAPSDDKLFFDN